VNEGDALGRPPGVEQRSLLIGGPQRANRSLCAKSVLKEIAMKTFIIATMLTAGVLLQPQTATVGRCGQIDNKATISANNTLYNTASTVLEKAEMQSLQGAGILDCYGWVDENGDRHGMCCVNLWLFRLCGDVNVSAVDRLLSSLI
jgi:hypothetical protein